jgi:hypothetical protein
MRQLDGTLETILVHAKTSGNQLYVNLSFVDSIHRY